MTITTSTEQGEAPTASPRAASVLAAIGRRLLTDRVLLLAVLIAALILTATVLDASAALVAPFTLSYLSVSLISFVPLALLALAQTIVILSGKSGIDLSVGGVVSLGGMIFGYLVVGLELSVPLASVITLVATTLMGAANGYLVGYLGFPPLIATLATGYAFGSIAMVSHDGAPFSGPALTELNSITHGLGDGVLAIPLHVLTVLVPVAVLAWFALNRTRWGRSLFAIGTNDNAARYSAIDTRLTRTSAYAASGLLAGLTAIVNVAQFASARPDAGIAGNGMALPAITIAVLGGVAIAGGTGRIGGTVLAALFVVWLNAVILISFQGSMGPRIQLLALGLVLVGAVLLNTFASRRYGLRQ